MNFYCRILEWFWRSIQSYMHILTYTYTYLFELQKKRHPAHKINIKNTKSSHKIASKTRMQRFWRFLTSLPPTSVGETSSFSLVLSPRGTSWTVFRAWLLWVAWVRLEEFFGLKQVLKTNGWSPNNPLIRPSFLEVVGIEVPLNSHKNKDITNTVLKKKVEYNMDLRFFLEAIQSNIIEALQDMLRYYARKEWHQILFPSTSHQRRSQLCSNLIMLATNLSKEKEALNI